MFLHEGIYSYSIEFIYILFEIQNFVTYQMLMFKNFDNFTIIFEMYYFSEFKIF